MINENGSRLYSLDIGVGRGGSYLTRQMTPGIGVDIDGASLKQAKAMYGIEAVVANAFHLPFADGTVQSICMNFPHDSALYGLARVRSGLWSEFRRVLEPQGSVDVVFDVYPEGSRWVMVNGDNIYLPEIKALLTRSARKSQFTVSIEKAGSKFLTRDLGTNYAVMAARRSWEDSAYTSYRLHAVKV